MAHRIRKEKICLNCGTETLGHYCPSCGQKNLEPKQSLWHILTHIFSDLTHWDGKFFTTVKDLFTKPGFLSREYVIGRRARYLDPIRMYIFTSAIFFLIFFSIFSVEKMHVGAEHKDIIEKDPDLRELLSKVSSSKDSLRILRKYNGPETKYVEVIVDSTVKRKKRENINIGGISYNSNEEYELAQKLLPPKERDGWFERKIKHRLININKRYENEPGGLIREMVNKFMHNSPKVLFISLPIFALLLKLLYIRRKEFYYVDHGIFAVHLYIFSFLVLLVLFGLNSLKDYSGWSIFNWIFGILCIYPFVYYYKAMRRFYAQGRWKTILKYTLLLILSLIVQASIFGLAFAFSALEV